MEYLGRNITLIGEVKINSPSGFKSRYSWDYLFNLANKHPAVDMISIHTDKLWSGSFDLLKEARNMTKKPILAKGYHPTDKDVRKAFNLGADAVLVVGRIPNIALADFCYFEPISLDQLISISAMSGSYRIKTVVWNSRDISHPNMEKQKSENINLARLLWNKNLIQASKIKSLEDINPVANGILVGSYLPEFLYSIK